MRYAPNCGDFLEIRKVHNLFTSFLLEKVL